MFGLLLKLIKSAFECGKKHIKSITKCKRKASNFSQLVSSSFSNTLNYINTIAMPEDEKKKLNSITLKFEFAHNESNLKIHELNYLKEYTDTLLRVLELEKSRQYKSLIKYTLLRKLYIYYRTELKKIKLIDDSIFKLIDATSRHAYIDIYKNKTGTINGIITESFKVHHCLQPLEPLGWNWSRCSIFGKICFKMKNDFKDQEINPELIEKLFEKSYSCTYEISEIPDTQYAKDLLIEWLENNKYDSNPFVSTNMIKELLIGMCEYKISYTDNSLVLYLLLEKRNYRIMSANITKKELIRISNRLIRDMQIKDLIRTTDYRETELLELFPQFNFISLFEEFDGFGKQMLILQSLYNTILITSTAKELFDSNQLGQVTELIKNHPKLQIFGFFPTPELYELKYIHDFGWFTWLKIQLQKKGIGCRL